MWRIIVFGAALFCCAQANNQEGGFKLMFEKCEMANYNKDWVKDSVIECTKINETHFKVDGSGTLLKDMNFDEVMATGQVYVFEGGDYVIKPHLKMTLPSCEEYRSETFGYWKEIENHGNLKGCGLHKAGEYSVKDYIPRMKIKDVAVPKESRIKVSVKLAYHNDEILDIHFYVGVAPK